MTLCCCKSTSPLATIFLAVSVAAALLCYPTAAAAQTHTELDTESALTNALLLGEESLFWLLLDRSSGSSNPPADKEYEVVSNLLTLFDLQEKLTNSIGEAASQDDRSALTNMQTLLSKVINDSCNYINVTLHDSFTTDDVKACGTGDTINFMRQTFDCTQEAAKKLQTKLELLISIRASEAQVTRQFKRANIDYLAWIDRGNFIERDRKYLECVANSHF